jgi:hypothetical protein
MDEWADKVAEAAPGLRSIVYATEAVGEDRIQGDLVLPLSYVPVTAGEYLSAVEDVGSTLEGATTNEIGGSIESRAAADRIIFDHMQADTAPVRGGSTATRAGCTQSKSVPPGATVVAEPKRSTIPAVGVTRFSEGVVHTGGQVGGNGFQPVRVEEAIGLTMPEDAVVGTDVVVPYTLRSSGGVLICSD